MLPDSFRSRLALLFGGLALLIGGPVYFYIEHVLSEQLVVERGKAIHSLATSVAAVLAENLRERQREIDLLAQSPLYRRSDLSSQDLTRSLERLQAYFPRYSWLGVADADGTVRAATGNLLVGVSVKQRPWFNAALRGSFTGDLHEAVLLAKLLPSDPGAGPPRFVDFAAPIYQPDGKLRGVLGAHANWAWVGDVIKVIVPPANGQAREIFIVDRDGKVIYPDQGEHSIRIPETLSDSRPFTLGHWDDSTRYLSSLVPVPAKAPAEQLQWRVLIRQPEAVALASLHAIQERLVFFGLLAAGALMVLTYGLASLLSLNLEKLAGFARDIEHGADPAAFSLPVSTTSEVQHLFDALRSMAGKLLNSQHALERTVSERTAELEKANQELRRLARRDALTGLHNRFAANEVLQAEFRRMQRSGIHYAVLLIDIDYFKRVNDTYGHEVGDLMLQGVAAILLGNLRATDFVARFGGEEFLALLPATGPHEAIQVAEKVRVAIASIPAPGAGSATVSIGVAVADMADSDETLVVLRADEHLYRAKEGGRNRVVGGLPEKGDTHE